MAEFALSKIIVVVIVVAVGLVLLGIITGVLDIGKVLKSVGGDALCTQIGWFCEEEEGDEDIIPPALNYIYSFGISKIEDNCNILLEWKPAQGRENDIKGAMVYWDYTEYLDDFPSEINTNQPYDITGCQYDFLKDRKCLAYFWPPNKGTGDYRFLLEVYDSNGKLLESKEAGPTGAEYVLCDYLRSDTGTGETFQEMILSNADGNRDDELKEKTEEWFESYDTGLGYGEHNWGIMIGWASTGREAQIPSPFSLVCGADNEMSDKEIGNNQALVYLHRCTKTT